MMTRREQYDEAVRQLYDLKHLMNDNLITQRPDNIAVINWQLAENLHGLINAQIEVTLILLHDYARELKAFE